MPTILQVSDTHLSPRNGLFLDNLEALRRIALGVRPDLTVFSGDLSLDGADREEDLAFAAERLRAFPGALMFLPGNHDVGSHPCSMPHQLVDATRLARFRRHFGPGRGAVDLPGWRVVGLDTEVMDTGVAEEADQAAFLAGAVQGLGARRLALFLHKPLFVEAQDTTRPDPWTVPPAARTALAPALAHPALRLVASGHLHMIRRRVVGQVAHLWAPAASFMMGPEDQDGIEGDRRCGALLHRLGADAVDTEVVTEGIESIHLDTVRHRTYPRPAPG
jgi:alkaline phosphatase D